MFSAKAAALLREKHLKVDWGQRDRDLLALVSAGVEVRACQLCSMIDHQTQFCPQYKGDKVQNEHWPMEKVDKQGRSRHFYEGKEICNNFNGLQGCFRNQCPLKHVCLKCKSETHAAHLCQRKKRSVNENASHILSSDANKTK